ncbi:MAG: BrnA antitoxin family protein [Candidatus Aminicenantes bacterium]|nr:BrnA antitoxin family protein [Candidatus Aminicenantes bacterium]
MKKEYDFSNSVKNPYTKKLKKQVTIRIDADTIQYFKNLARELGIPYQNLINLYLSDCAQQNRKLSLEWRSIPPRKNLQAR